MPALRTALCVVALTCFAPAVAAQQPLGHDQAVGQQFHVTADSLPSPGATPSSDAAPVKLPRGTHMPVLPEGFTATLFVEDLENPRRILVQDDNLVLFAQQALGRVLKLRDIDDNGTADQGGLIAEGTLNPFGLALVPLGEHKGDLLLADQDAVYRLPTVSGGFVFDQVTPDGAFGEVAGHITRDLLVDPKSGALYVTVGSMSNLGEEPEVKGTIQRFDPDGKNQHTFASGIRNTTGMDFHPTTGALYAVVMERDGMGDQLVPDYFTKVEDGDFFGWPYQYTGGFVQPEFKDHAPKQAAAKMPSVLFEAHSAPLDVAFIPESWPEGWRGDAIVALHGSSNSGVPTGYKLVRVHFRDGEPLGTYENFMTGFWVSGQSPAEVWGRPAALAFDKAGALYVADDFGNTIWKVTPPAP
jgi:glucose/arabinose dehydrogenase